MKQTLKHGFTGGLKSCVHLRLGINLFIPPSRCHVSSLQTTALGQVVMDFRNDIDDTDVIELDGRKNIPSFVSRRMFRGSYEIQITQKKQMKKLFINLGDHEHAETIPLD